jgi:hypothetical protein
MHSHIHMASGPLSGAVRTPLGPHHVNVLVLLSWYSSSDVEFTYVKLHSGILLHECTDLLATRRRNGHRRGPAIMADEREDTDAETMQAEHWDRLYGDDHGHDC